MGRPAHVVVCILADGPGQISYCEVQRHSLPVRLRVGGVSKNLGTAPSHSAPSFLSQVECCTAQEELSTALEMVQKRHVGLMR